VLTLLQNYSRYWKLSEDNLSAVKTDNSSNIVAACDITGYHASVIPYNLLWKLY